MIRQLITIPRDTKFYVACSGGIDSMVVCDFYLRGGRTFGIAHFNHQTPQAGKFDEFVSDFADRNCLTMISANLVGKERPKGTSKEEWWRNERYDFFKSLPWPVITCHHLSDVAEGWIFGALNGQPRLIKPKRENILRPFLTTSKEDIVAWAKKHSVAYVEDSSNNDIRFARNNIRHNILPRCLSINPGLLTMLRKKVIADYKETQ